MTDVRPLHILLIAALVPHVRLPAAHAGPNLAPNSGFEEGEAGRPFDWAPSARFSALPDGVARAEWAADERHAGKRALKLEVHEAQRFTLDWRSSMIPIEGGSSLDVSGWVKTGSVVPGQATWHRAGFTIVYFDEAGQRLRHSDVARVERTDGWRLHSARLRAPGDAASALVSLGLSLCTGTVWFDDVDVRVAAPSSAIPPGLFPDPSAPPPQAPVLIPQPWREQFDEQYLRFGPAVAILCADRKRHAHTVAEAGSWLDGLGLRRVALAEADSLIVVGDPRARPDLSRWTSFLPAASDLDRLTEAGYVVGVGTVGERTVVAVASVGGPGAYCGLQTLRQWVEHEGERVVLRQGAVTDKPAYRRRGLVSGTYSLKRLDLVKSHKRNMVLLTTREGSHDWDKPFDDAMRATLREYHAECARRHILAVPGVHPGKGGTKLHLSDQTHLDAILSKYDEYRAAGFRNFSLRLDDMAMYGGQDRLIFEDDRQRFGTVANAHAYLIETAARHAKSLDVGNRLFVVPMHYWFDGSAAEEQYLRRLGQMDVEVELINCGATREHSLRRHVELTGRTPWIWDNYVARYEKGPAVPDIIAPLALAADPNLHEHVRGYLFPMLDKDMMWYTISDYLWRGEDFDPNESARRALVRTFGVGAFTAIQQYANLAERTRFIPVSGATSVERVAVLQDTAAQLRLRLEALHGLLPTETYADLQREVEERCSFIEGALVPQEQQKPFPSVIPACASPPTIDGKLDEAAWKRAGGLSGFVQPFGRGPDIVPAAAQTEAFLTHGRDSLFIAVRCAEPEMRRVKAVRTERDSEVHLEDSLTLYIQPGDGGGPFYRLSVNALGAVYDARSYDVNWDGDFRVAASRDTDSWSVEIALPSGSLNAGSIQPGVRWRFSIGRTREAGGHEDSSWVVMKRGLHEIQRLWTIEFAGP